MIDSESIVIFKDAYSVSVLPDWFWDIISTYCKGDCVECWVRWVVSLSMNVLLSAWFM